MTIVPPGRVLFILTLAILLALGDYVGARGPRGGGGRARGGFSGGGRSGGFSAGPGRAVQASPRGVSAPRASAGGLSGKAPSGGPGGKLGGGLQGRTAGEVQGFLGGAKSNAIQSSGNLQSKAQAAKPQNRNGQHASNAQNAAQNFQNGPQPFSPAWYAQHPTAWQHTHPHADAAAVATAATVGAWFAHGAYPYPVATGGGSTVVYEQTTVYENAAPTPTPVEPASPSDAAATPDPASPAWLSLGVYELKPTVGAHAAQAMRLAVNRQGAIKGVYLDHLAGTVENIAGQIDMKSQTATWSVEGNRSVSFSAPLANLTQPQGGVTVALPGGSQTWLLERSASQ